MSLTVPKSPAVPLPHSATLPTLPKPWVLPVGRKVPPHEKRRASRFPHAGPYPRTFRRRQHFPPSPFQGPESPRSQPRGPARAEHPPGPRAGPGRPALPRGRRPSLPHRRGPGRAPGAVLAAGRDGASPPSRAEPRGRDAARRMSPLRVCIVGSGNWGSAIARIIGKNVQKSNRFDPTVKMWVFEEIINGRKLSEIINQEHENVKYLPGYKIPHNVVAVPDVAEAANGADILVFVLPHQFIGRICEQIAGQIKPGTFGISLIKGIDEGPDGLKLISDLIREQLKIEISVLMGANIAKEVADEKFCETTIGCKNETQGEIFKELMQTPNFRITVVLDTDTVELCGALKNIVAVGAGFCDGLSFGDNTKAAVIRLGLMEMVAFAKMFCKGPVSIATFLESCGVADLITTCYGGRNRKVAEAFARTGKSIEELEKEMLNGQKLQGPQTSAEVYKILKQKDLLHKFPLFTTIYKICYEGRSIQDFIMCLQNHPEHM
ncbi:LOW QUALITY PROTEIN: glycerol-3-phosphate dehydrogenase [NAD(+)], cytoplasmic-like [Agelaius tricolor]|uniref:LOW QUALITY PROTEIN: glycerol-3-phosphate dehydrogenase [NAD(+)], cytoplasmic-like n=1 Tax=Agelaius tricolor TaxID=9191 RepID=UPI0039F212C4